MDRHDARDRPDPRGHQLEQVGVALADHLGEDVEATGGDDHVVDLLDVGERLGDRLARCLDDDAEHRLPGEAELERVGHGGDLHDPGVVSCLTRLTTASSEIPTTRRWWRRSGGRPAGAAR